MKTKNKGLQTLPDKRGKIKNCNPDRSFPCGKACLSLSSDILSRCQKNLIKNTQSKAIKLLGTLKSQTVNKKEENVIDPQIKKMEPEIKNLDNPARLALVGEILSQMEEDFIKEKYKNKSFTIYKTSITNDDEDILESISKKSNQFKSLSYESSKLLIESVVNKTDILENSKTNKDLLPLIDEIKSLSEGAKINLAVSLSKTFYQEEVNKSKKESSNTISKHINEYTKQIDEIREKLISKGFETLKRDKNKQKELINAFLQ